MNNFYFDSIGRQGSHTGLSLRAGGGDFPQLLREWPPATFIGK